MQVLSADALRMRLKRMCQMRGEKGACHVDQSIHDDWKAGGEKREWLEIALLEAIKDVGTDTAPGTFKKVKAGSTYSAEQAYRVLLSFALQVLLPAEASFQRRVVVVRERMESKEREIHGEWMTEEKMIKSGDFSALLVSNIQHCMRATLTFCGL